MKLSDLRATRCELQDIVCFTVPSRVQFSSVQLLSHVQLFSTPWTAPRQASLSITNSRSLPKPKTPIWQPLWAFLLKARSWGPSEPCAQLLSRVWLFETLMDCSPSGSSVHGIFPARILEWVAISSSRGSSWPRDQTHISCTGRQVFYHWDTPGKSSEPCPKLKKLLHPNLHIFLGGSFIE